jgi:hypothetical protein
MTITLYWNTKGQYWEPDTEDSFSTHMVGVLNSYVFAIYPSELAEFTDRCQRSGSTIHLVHTKRADAINVCDLVDLLEMVLPLAEKEAERVPDLGFSNATEVIKWIRQLGRQIPEAVAAHAGSLRCMQKW